MGYLHDVFISYPFGELDNPFCLGEWVRTLFEPALRTRLKSVCRHEPSVFIDKRCLKNGPVLDDQLRKHLGRSKILVPVWDANYFRRRYCMNEWHSMMQREDTLGGPPPQLVYPIIWDGSRDDFPTEAQRAATLRSFCDYSNLMFPMEATVQRSRFVAAVREVATELAALIKTAPDWQSGWPVELNAPIEVDGPMPHPTGAA